MSLKLGDVFQTSYALILDLIFCVYVRARVCVCVCVCMCVCLGMPYKKLNLNFMSH